MKLLSVVTSAVLPASSIDRCWQGLLKFQMQTGAVGHGEFFFISFGERRFAVRVYIVFGAVLGKGCPDTATDCFLPVQ